MMYNLYQLKDLQDTSVMTELENGSWVPARPLRYYSILNDLKLAWLVFRRKADAFTWPGDQ